MGAIQPSLFRGFSLPFISVGDHAEGLILTTYGKCAAITESPRAFLKRMQHQNIAFLKLIGMVESYAGLRLGLLKTQ
jgi:hypothetical protein